MDTKSFQLQWKKVNVFVLSQKKMKADTVCLHLKFFNNEEKVYIFSRMQKRTEAKENVYRVFPPLEKKHSCFKSYSFFLNIFNSGSTPN